MFSDLVYFRFVRNSVEKGLQTTDLYLAKVRFTFLNLIFTKASCFSDILLLMQAWFHSSQPMTRSRSSELRYLLCSAYISQNHIHENFNLFCS